MRHLREFFYIALGVAVASVGLKAFLLPNGFLDGGVTGIAILLEVLTGAHVSVTLPLLSVPFLVLAYFTLSRRIVIKSVVSILSLAAVLELGTVPVITEDKLLIAIFGGLCLGVGIGITIRNGAVLDGSEVLGVFFNDRFGIEIGKVVLAFNVILFGVTALLVSAEVAMYSILTYLVAAEVTNQIMRGFEDFIGITVVSPDHARAIQEAIITDLGAGVTVYRGQGGYGARGQQLPDQPILHTIVNRIDVRRLYRLIDGLDASAFIVEFDVHHVRGGVLRRYLTRGRGRTAESHAAPPAQ